MRTFPLVLCLAAACGTTADAGPSPLKPPTKAYGLQLVRPDARPADLDQLPIYEIDQAIDDVSGRFSARLVVRYTNVTGKPVAAIPLLLHPNAPAELGAAAGTVGTLAITKVTLANGVTPRWQVVRPTLVTVQLPAPLAPKAQLALHVDYKGELRNLGPKANDMFAQAMSTISSLASAGTSDYGLMAMGDGIVTLASAFPMIAPWREGAFDTAPPSRIGDLAYNGPASFRVRTALPTGVKLVSNLVDAAPVPGKHGTQTVVSEGAMVRDLVFVAGRDLQRIERRVGPTRVASVYRAKDARGGKVALDAAAAALASFEKRFGPYPYTELDIVEASIVGGAGGVEFCAMTLIAGGLYRNPLDSTSPMAMVMKMLDQFGGMLGGGSADASTKQQIVKSMDAMLEFTVAHEVAHQWFAELLGNDSGRFPMVDEPLAQYAAGLAMEDRHGAAAARTAMDSSVKMNYALYRMLGGTDRSVLRATTTYKTQIEYAALVYGKAPYLYVALRKSLGAAALDRAIRTAVAERKFQLTTIDEWIATLERAAGGSRSGVRPAFKRWLAEAHGDADLRVDDSGDFVIATMFPPDIAKMLKDTLGMVGLSPRELLGMLFGGSLADDALTGPGIDPDQALQGLGP